MTEGDNAGEAAATGHSSSRTPLLRHALHCFACALVTFALYHSVRHFEFLNFDDPEYVLENPFVQSGASFRNIVAAFTTFRGGHYHPLSWLSHMLDVSMFGLDPGPMHLENAAIHALNCALLCSLLLRYKQHSHVAVVTTLLFGLHPLRIESVAWIAERKDVLSLSFGFACFHCWLSFRNVTRDWTQRWSAKAGLFYGLTLLLFGLALLSKPTLVPLPLLLLILEHQLRGGQPTRKDTRAIAPLLILAAASTWVTAISQENAGAMGGLALAPRLIGDRITTAAVAYLAYAGKFFWPSGLGIFYPATQHAPGVGVGALFGLGCASWLFYTERRRRPALSYAWLWFLIAPLPVIGLVRFGGQAFADRWTYLAHVGLSLGVAQQLFQTLKPRTFVALSSAIIATLAATTLVNLPNWKDSETLFRHTLEVAPDNFLAHTNLGNALDKSGKLDSAVFHYEEAVRLNPSYPEALNNLGTARARKGRFTEAGPLFTAALARRPEFRLARYNQGLLEAEQGQLRRALSTWLTLLSQDPSYPAARQSLRALAGQRLFPLCPEPGATASLPNAPNGHPVLSTASETPLAPDATFNLEHLAARLEAWQPFPADVSLRQRLSAALPCISRLQ